jgi:uncharacterized protein YjbI with pentapeptide repeats
MDKGNLAAVPLQGAHIVFSDEVKDDLDLKGVHLQKCYFTRIGTRDAAFRDCKLTQCLFEDTYLRKAHFKNVQLTGSTFRKCNLAKATLSGCDLRFCTFEATLLDREEVIGNLPSEPNLRRDLARDLRKNFESLGDKESSDVFLTLEIKAHEEELLSAFRRKTDYYRQHYSTFEQVGAGAKYVGSRLSGLMWGYGHRVGRLVTSYLVLTLILALIIYLLGVPFIVDANMPVRALGFGEAIYQTLGATLGTGTATFSPAFPLGKMLQVLERFLGTLFLALLAAVTYRRIAR